VQAKQLALPKDGNFEVALAPRRRQPARENGRLKLRRCARLAADRHARDARELPTPAARFKPASSCASSWRGATRPDALTVPQRAVLEGPQGNSSMW